MSDKLKQLNLKLSYLELQFLALGKQKELLLNQFPSDPEFQAWCADYTEGLSGEVGLIEIPAEVAEKITYLNSQSKLTASKYSKINIRPGFTDDAAYSASRDKEIVPVVAMSAAQMFYNKSVLPGVQKWLPRFRYGIIVTDSLDFGADTCSVCLDAEYSSQQNLGVNQGDTFSECEGDVPSGFSDFCDDNPSHPTCVNTIQGGGYQISDAMLATIKSVNQSINNDHEYQTDKAGYGIGEYWTEMSAGQKGDCEDFAMTKQKALYDAGIPIQHLQLAIGETEAGGWHAFLMIRSGNRGDLVLDNRFEDVRKLANVPYRFHSYQNAGSQWNGYGVRLTGVPIEYMNCHAGAFADGDEVLVEFTDQDFSQPKVIGFKENPVACDTSAYFISTPGLFPSVSDIAIDTLTWIAQGVSQAPEPYSRRARAAGAKVENKVLIVGGLHYYPQDTSFGYEDWDGKLGVVGINQAYSYGNWTYELKQSTPNKRMALTGFGNDGKAWFAGGVYVFVDHWFGTDHSYEGEITSRCWFNCGWKCHEDVWDLFYKSVDPYDETDEYTLLSDSWANRASMQNERGLARGFSIEHNLFVFGGSNGHFSARDIYCVCCYEVIDVPPLQTWTSPSTHYRAEYIRLKELGTKYDSVTDSWESIQSLTHTRAGYSAAVFNAKGYIFLGSSNTKQSSGDYFLGVWPTETDLDTGTEGCYYGECTHPNGRYQIWNTMGALEFDPLGESFSTLESLPNNEEENLALRDNIGTGLTYAGYQEASPAVAIDTGIIVSTYQGLNEEVSPIYEYNPITDSYTERGEWEQIRSISNGVFGQIGFSP